MSKMDSERYCSVQDSLIQSCKEVALIRSGDMPKRTWDDLLLSVEKMKTESEVQPNGKQAPDID